MTSRDSHATDKNRIDKNRKEKNIENYSDVPELDEAIKEFIKFRKNAKKPMTDNAVKLLINKLNKFTTNVNEQIEILNQSIMNGWTGIYELKQDAKKPVNIGYQQSDVDDMPFFT